MNYKERQKIIASSPISFKYLRRFNIAAGVLHLIMGIMMLALGLILDWTRDVYTFYIKLDIISTAPPVFEVAPDPQVLFSIGYLGVILAIFPLMSAIAHLAIAFPKNERYNKFLKKGMNPYRWYEYALSSSVMIFVIALFLVWDFWSLVMIFVLNAITMMFGHQMELLNQKTEKTKWSPFVLGCVTGFTPWIILFVYFLAAVNSSGAEPPAFVYLILFIYFGLFNVFALNMILQYKGIGKWKDYLYGERMFIILSFVAKTALAWLVFTGIFAPF
jgi:sulfite exporter TauE/SafE